MFTNNGLPLLEQWRPSRTLLGESRSSRFIVSPQLPVVVVFVLRRPYRGHQIFIINNIWWESHRGIPLYPRSAGSTKPPTSDVLFIAPGWSTIAKRIINSLGESLHPSVHCFSLSIIPFLGKWVYHRCDIIQAP